jgi:HD superfamily phosphohydrolase
MAFKKIINDPVYGFITINDPLIHRVIAHPYYQRLRRIHQMAMAQLVYPGAVHTRLHHSLGAYHLMGNAINELRQKGNDITAEEEQAAKLAILLHDIGHGPFSHALEHVLIPHRHHEELSLAFMEALNREFDGALTMAMDIFQHRYPKKYLHQLISGQLDVDRMDYLTRDSFFSGVSEGVIGYDRILKMLTVHDGELMVEEKGIYSIEKFLVARRLMYWQVYLHKTVLCAEQMLKRIIRRARLVGASAPEPLNRVLHEPESALSLDDFSRLDDYDVLTAIKHWATHPDRVLALLSKGIVDRQLLKVRYLSEPATNEQVEAERAYAQQALSITANEAEWLVFTGEASSSTYNFRDEQIQIVFKDGTVRDISEVDHALISQNLMGKVKKYYICFHR